MQLIVVSDIFGKTPEFISLVSKVSQNYSHTVLCDPYDGEYIDFENENAAYSYFQKTIGLDRYTDSIFEKIKNTKEHSHLIGFSVGASVVWRISQENVFHKKTRAIVFYGSQIRNFLDINPRIEIDLFFPKIETHFDVSVLIKEISKRPHVRCFKTKYLHGFMNKRSENYDEDGCSEYLKIITQY